MRGYLLVFTKADGSKQYVGPFASFAAARGYGQDYRESGETYVVENLWPPEDK